MSMRMRIARLRLWLLQFRGSDPGQSHWMRMRVAYLGTWCLCLGAIAGSILLVVTLSSVDEQAARQHAPIIVGRNREEVFIDKESIEDGGFDVASRFMVPIHDAASLQELREAIRVRSDLGRAVLKAELDRVRIGFRPPPETVVRAGQLLREIGLLELYDGRYPEAATWFQKALEITRPRDIPERDRARAMALLGVVALRRSEARNDSDARIPSSGGETNHARLARTREAAKKFTAYLEEWPGDLRVRWLLNLAYRELGEYPENVPRAFLVPLDPIASTLDVGRFEDVGPSAGLGARGPNTTGGTVFDDLNGDSLPDLLTTSLDAERGASLFINRGNGRFEDRSAGTGLEDQVYALNATHADIDNDGDLDVLFLRGGWERPLRLSLLENRGDGTFSDRTVARGLAEPIATGAAAWGDYDNDGRVDLFICGEFGSPSGDSGSARPDPRNRCRLYHNGSDGRFIDVAMTAGVVNERFAKGVAWGDYDDDGRLDLYVSNRNGHGRLYHNEGDGTFRDVAPALGLTGAGSGSACWFWDYDNDGRLDLYVSDDGTSLAEAVAAALDRPVGEVGRPRLYRNLGGDGFREVAREVGLDRPIPALGCNFGDIDNDGCLDIYVGTGWRSASGLIPNRMFKSVEGGRFEDVTLSSGTGHFRKGQSVSFADWDGDGDLDLFIGTGGVVPGDKSDNLLFQNPGHGRHWLKVRLVGSKTNRAAIGARIRVDRNSADGGPRSIYRTLGNNSCLGGNCLVQSIGLLDATRVDAITVSWPSSRTSQTFRDIAADQMIEITEGATAYRVLRPPLPRPTHSGAIQHEGSSAP
jgi:tetratricopeptide (TPR) repeat protein